MTHDEEMAARGRLMTDYSEAKKRLATLLYEANRLGEIYSKFGARVKDLGRSPSSLVIHVDETMHTAIDNPCKVWTLLEEIKETEARLITLGKQVRDLGLA